MSKMKILIFSCLFVVMHIIQETKTDEAIGYFLNYVEYTLSPYKVNLMIVSSNQLSHFAKNFAAQVNERLLSHNRGIVNTSVAEIEAIDYNYFTNYSHKYHIKDYLERTSLTMGILDSEQEADVLLHETMNLVRNFIALSPLMRGKYIIHLRTNLEIDLKDIFRFAWSWRFLDLTIIKWTQDKQILRNEIKSSQILRFQGFVYIYNPYNDELSEEILTANTALFPDKSRNLNGYPLRIIAYQDDFVSPRISESWPPPELNSWASLSNEDGVNIMETLFECLNASMKLSKFKLSRKSPRDILEIKEMNNNFVIGFTLSYRSLESISDNQDSQRQILINYFRYIHHPYPAECHFYFMRRKEYEMRISPEAILAFGGLFFTAFIFAAWARLLGFKEPNWSFLNILTAQMGGSLEHHGPMRLSEMIFQISIYTATFIVVTLGGDYMYQIFVLHQELPVIESLQDLANSGYNFIMENHDENFLQFIRMDQTVQDIVKRIEFRRTELSGTHSFCRPPSSSQPVLDEFVNLCMSCSREVQHIYESNSQFQVDKIKPPIINEFLKIVTGSPPTFVKERAEQLIQKFMQVGLIDKWEHEGFRKREAAEEIFENSERAEANKSEEVPLQDQLWPILVVGFTAGTIALIGELIWKHLIERTALGQLVKAYYSDLHSSSEKRVGKSHQPTASTSVERKRLNFHVQHELKKIRHIKVYPKPDSGLKTKHKSDDMKGKLELEHGD
ncbi:hypothetical protein QAD02_001411 [Eretmocerus hayati]|uniref:Uncharacterized protein n=1 Tax=Eretmocerus hayati TaxID=131215 RepID=A0ACC2NIU0_9HYME|nr:hypothetical protein QAD02_001411 [Eretmocerus hayati]